MTTIRDIISGTTENEIPDVLEHACGQLLACLDDNGSLVAWLHGSDKQTVVNKFTAAAREAAATVIRIDGRNVEPTPSGLMAYLCSQTSKTTDKLDLLAKHISGLADRVVLVFENYEVLRLADFWIRSELIPSLDANVRIIFSSREPPAVGWINSAIWQQHFTKITLPTDNPEDSVESAMHLLDEVSDAEVRRALTSLSISRRITHPLIAALCPESDTEDLYEKLAALSFIDARRDGLASHPLLQKALAGKLQAADPGRYRELQRAAWQCLRGQLRQTVRADLWRSTADVIYLIENPVIREAFFPSQSARYSVEPAVPSDHADIFDIIARTEPASAVEAMQLWWKHLPSAFHIVRDTTGSAVGFYCAAAPQDLSNSWMRFDPLASLWLRDLERAPSTEKPSAIFLRRWLSIDDGESPGAIQAAAWVDIKRTYLENRPDLRRVYLTLQDIGPYAAVATKLGFSVIEDATTKFTGIEYYTAMLDFGPGSVDGWICNLLAAELGITGEQLLDSTTRELVYGENRVPLTPLEFGVMAMLESHAGDAVSRGDLLRQVWGHGHEGGSNVVDAVVRGLRKKLTGSDVLIETMRGIGYRLSH